LAPLVEPFQRRFVPEQGGERFEPLPGLAPADFRGQLLKGVVPEEADRDPVQRWGR